MDITSLTYREKTVLLQLKEGKKDEEIALVLCNSKHVVAKVLRTLFQKTNCPNRTALISWAYQNNLYHQIQEA